MSIRNDLSDLLKAEIITQETADRIHAYYKTKDGSTTNRLFVVFGILGAILIGLGITLIIAHNWDELSRGTKTVIAFIPLLTGQALCGFTLMKKRESIAWRESTSAFLFFTVGSSIALVSQIYNIPGGTGTFLLTWMLLCLPLVYLMNSSVTSLFYISGITWYAAHLGYDIFPSASPYLYWLLFLGILPHYYLLYRKEPGSNFMVFHNWLIPLSVIIALGTLAKSSEELITIAYMSLFGLLFFAGDSDFFPQQKPGSNGYKILGALGTIVLLLILSFDWFWQHLGINDFRSGEVFISPEFFAAAITSLLAGVLFLRNHKHKPLMDMNPLAPVFILFIGTFILGLFAPTASVVMINLFVFAIGVLTIVDGARKGHLGILNFGLLVVTALVICRFFDSDLPFLLRGLLFMMVGAGFFAANYWILKQRKRDE